MKRPLIEIAVAVFFVAFTSCAQNPNRLQPPPAPLAVKGVKTAANDAEFSGIIDSIDMARRLIRVQHWPLSKTFQVPPGCEIDISTNVNSALAQLKVDDGVVVTYSGEGRNLVANRIVRMGKAQQQERQERYERLEKMLNPSPNQ